MNPDRETLRKGTTLRNPGWGSKNFDAYLE